MEIRASYLLVGSVVLALLAGLAGFSVWLVKADVDRQTALYEIVFAGTVSGLRQGGQVLYRGIPVGRVAEIRIDPENVENVLVTAEIERSTPITKDTVATLEMQGITGIAYVQLRGGTRESVRLNPDAKPRPRIPSRRSALEQVFESGPELLARGVALVDRLSLLLDEKNVGAIGATLNHLETFTATLAQGSDKVDATLGGATKAAHQVQETAADLQRLITDVRGLTGSVDQQVEGVSGNLDKSLTEARSAAAAMHQAADRLNGLIGDLHQPLDDFAGTGLYEFTQLVGETRLLVAALSRITKEFERDPAGFLIGRSKGFEGK
jgi:phospholipid/cholesterol/gamma-HCH transport system substrate-binding protein